MSGEMTILDHFKFWPDALFFIDCFGNIQAINQHALNLLHADANELLQQNAHQCLCADARGHYHEPDECMFHIHQQQDVTSGLWKTLHDRNLHVDFRLFYIAEFDLVAVSFIDTSGKRHSQAEMQRLSDFADLNPAPLAQLNKQADVLFANPALTELMLEYGFDDQTGLARILPSDIMALCDYCINQQQQKEHVISRVDAQVFEWYLYPINSDDEQSIFAVAFDVTAKVNAEQLQREAEVEMRAKQEAAKRDFYAKMLHELRTPLNAIIGYAELLVDKADNLNDKQTRQLKTIRNAGHQLGELVTSTLELSKIEAGALSFTGEQLGIRSLAENVIHQLAGQAEYKQLELRFICDADYQLYADRQKIQQIMQNLVSNAVKYTSEGFVMLHLSLQQHKAVGECLCIRVADSGMGIAKAQIPNLFTAYRRVNESEITHIQGTGLGLSLVQELVNMHSGVIEVLSSPGKGSIFSVFIPLSLPPA